MELPEFSGVYTEWLDYRDLSYSMVKSDKDFPTVQKLHYLNTSLVD